ncbi:hypothetical protein CDAR_548921 [Caerostris darwini]|uniref:Ycf15 n=1 Tax=Caerostris darwini TaxID=1538125 RepID=A0AAV4WIP9_9ARAC|nr:hypothetical protein CDAR_548921 [Caerostris darwini]
MTSPRIGVFISAGCSKKGISFTCSGIRTWDRPDPDPQEGRSSLLNIAPRKLSHERCESGMSTTSPLFFRGRRSPLLGEDHPHGTDSIKKKTLPCPYGVLRMVFPLRTVRKGRLTQLNTIFGSVNRDITTN